MITLKLTHQQAYEVRALVDKERESTRELVARWEQTIGADDTPAEQRRHLESLVIWLRAQDTMMGEILAALE